MVWPVISVAQLRELPDEDDEYERLPPPGQRVMVDGDTDEWQSHEVDRIVKRRTVWYGGKPSIDYLI
jgi:hypothetical protein